MIFKNLNVKLERWKSVNLIFLIHLKRTLLLLNLKLKNKSTKLFKFVSEKNVKLYRKI